jgi:hypothetical protein
MEAEDFIKRCKKCLRIIDNYHIPEDVKLKRVEEFFRQAIHFEHDQVEILDKAKQPVFDLLCNDMIRQCNEFLQSPAKNIDDAKNIMNIMLTVEEYVSDVQKVPWQLGRKVSRIEKMIIRWKFRKALRESYDEKNKRTVRKTRAKIVLTGSLARGRSDWKTITGEIPKPTDYGLPKEYRTASKTILRQIDTELNLQQELKPLMSDVDILIVNEVLYDSIHQSYSSNGWSFKLGEKYPTGVGASNILAKIHQKLENTKIGGIKGRWVNYIVVRDDKSYNRYIQERNSEVEKLRQKTGKDVDVTDVEILDEIIR